MRTFYSLALVLLVVPAYAQKYEIGVHGGGSMYLSREVTAAAGTADAGFKMGFGAGFNLGHNMYERLGGEIRYTYLRNDLKVSSGGTEVKFAGESHVIHYDLLVHTADRQSRVRPYVAFGAGVKQFRGTGDEVAYRPLQNFAIPTKTTEVQPMVSFGGGIKFAISERLVFRADVHDFFTPFPKEVLAPGPGASVGGWLHNIVPTAGITFTF
jgi:hypothetical protein